MLVGLIGGGKGLQEMLSNNFEGFATNSAIVFNQPTTKAFDGFRKGRDWSMEYKDVDRLKAQVPEVGVAVALVRGVGSKATAGGKKGSVGGERVFAAYFQVGAPKTVFWRLLHDKGI